MSKQRIGMLDNENCQVMTIMFTMTMMTSKDLIPVTSIRGVATAISVPAANMVTLPCYYLGYCCCKKYLIPKSSSQKRQGKHRHKQTQRTFNQFRQKIQLRVKKRPLVITSIVI